MSKIIVDQLCYDYGKKEVLKQISFTANSGQNFYLLGPNGAGKSTLFRCIMGHLKPSSGHIYLNDKEVKAYSAKELAMKVAYIPQSCQPSFNYSVLQVAMMGRTAHLSAFAFPNKRDYEMAYKVLEQLDIANKANQGICEVSGGEKQLAMIARALVQEAEILLMDEPTSNLDYGNQIRIQQQMKKLSERGLLVVQSCHNPQHAMLFSDQVIVISQGSIIAAGKAEAVICASLLQQLYAIQVQVREKVLIPNIDEYK